ncbi:5'/3'-nucleotidase SurE [Streptomyces sp. NPDC017529]|uniref:5'/3'-nucleotidase SurE n=1 Tax=Streptomyces sp. NPDC017529 TaxID=3365000 RepID=UPI00379656D4
MSVRERKTTAAARRRAGGLGCAAAAAGLLVAGSGPVATGRPAAPAPGRPLSVLISNDDGFRHPYIRALQAALKKAGHTAVIVAPAQDMSGHGTRMTFTPGASLRAEETEPDVWSVGGSPGDSVAFGVQRVFTARTGRPPDLVVSGVNPGPNTGFAVNHSGTVGATVAAADAGVPALAVSAGYDAGDPRNPFPSAARAVDFTVRTVARLAATAHGGALLPYGTALNVNYPARPDGGLAFTNVGTARHVAVGYVPDPATCATCYKVRLEQDPDAPERVPAADTTALAANDVSVSLLTGDWGARGFAPARRPPSGKEAERTRARLYGLRP